MDQRAAPADRTVGAGAGSPVQARTQWTGPWLPTHDRSVSASSKNYYYSANMQIVIDTNTRLTVAISRPTPGNRHDCRAFRDSGVDRQYHGATVMTDGGYQGNLKGDHALSRPAGSSRLKSLPAARVAPRRPVRLPSLAWPPSGG